LSSLAGIYRDQKRYAEDEALLRRAMLIREHALGATHPLVAESLVELAQNLIEAGRHSDAEAPLLRALNIQQAIFSAQHPTIAMTRMRLAAVHRWRGEFDKAAANYARVLDALPEVFEPDHPRVVQVRGAIAELTAAQGDWRRAESQLRRSADILERRSVRVATFDGDFSRQNSPGLAFDESKLVKWLIKAGNRASLDAQVHFADAQRALSSDAAGAIAQMMSRRAAGNLRLTELVRQRQDLLDHWRRLTTQRIGDLSQPRAIRYQNAEAADVQRLKDVTSEMQAVDEELKSAFPDYFTYANPDPLQTATTQSQLRSDEALVLFLDTQELGPAPEETFIWVVTKTDMRWFRSSSGTPTLARDVFALRCGLDRSAWDGDGRQECIKALDLPLDRVPGPNDPLPFDAARAHALYKNLFGEVEDLIRDKHLLIVPSGPLTALPFQVLVTSPPATAIPIKATARGDEIGYRDVAWLGRRQPITVLPSVASLAALRRVAKPSRAPEPFIGWGNPVLTGAPGCEPISVPASCPEVAQLSPASRKPRSVTPVVKTAAAASSYFRGGLADVAEVRKLCPLPDTAHELACVARSLGAPASAIHVGAGMTETALKAMPLDRYRIVHFATHGLLAGEMRTMVRRGAEPALVLTPPDTPTEADDGLLTASEIASLKLDADWVILSACNTAAGSADGNEALSGLARAFFYAGARALLVSHWQVNSEAAVKLVTKAVAEMSSDPAIGRAEAMRRAMTALIDENDPMAAHPMIWAPFIVVGEGAAVQ
jgi:tetratricopeptide (TPR) repeat protein